MAPIASEDPLYSLHLRILLVSIHCEFVLHQLVMHRVAAETQHREALI